MKSNKQLNEEYIGTDNANTKINYDALAYGMIDLCEFGLVILDESNQVIYWNQWMENKSGSSNLKIIGKSLDTIFKNNNFTRLNRSIEDAQNQGMSSILSPKFNPHVLPLYTSDKDHEDNKLMSQMVTIKPLGIREKHSFIQIVDVSAASARDKLLRQQAIFSNRQALHTEAILGSIFDAVITTDENGRIDYLNPMAEQLTGWDAEHAKGRLLDKVFNLTHQDSKNKQDMIHQSLKNGTSFSSCDKGANLIRNDAVQLNIDFSIAPIRDQQHLSNGVVVVFRDVTDARILADKISWQATHDALTNLFNRNSFDKKLYSVTEDAQKNNSVHSLLYLDLDQFKIVNDTCGHVAGDELLKQIADLLEIHIRDNDILARLGGDEFGIILTSCPASIALRIAESIRQSIQDYRFGWEEKSFAIGVSIGIVEISAMSENVEKILGEADAACYSAKDSGRNQVSLYQPEDSDAADRHGEMAWFSRIQDALDKNSFLVYAQTILPLNKKEKKKHYEILIRMVDDNGSIIPPGAFIPAAERYGLMSSIDRWVIDKVFQSVKKSKERLECELPHFAINLSGATLTDGETLDHVTKQIQQNDIPKDMITFEITETAAISNLSAANYFIKSLKDTGCRFALDDFGSGLSSFAYLKNLPVDILKIDGAFVKDVHRDEIDRAMVESINQIGHVMGLETVAEFAENEEIIAVLADIGVDYIQGYGISKPRLLIDPQGNFLLD
ncbi:MAG: EAL domain-containing protein [Kangiellaceae bacterium]|nr:EAL domain-containing protein [Kangiellaceae bacterium]